MKSAVRRCQQTTRIGRLQENPICQHCAMERLQQRWEVDNHYIKSVQNHGVHKVSLFVARLLKWTKIDKEFQESSRMPV